MALSDTAVRNLKPLEKAYKKADGNGLYLFVTPQGGKIWRLDYALLGTRKTLTIGAYPAISLADARRARDDARELIAKNVDPNSVKRAEKAEAIDARANTFGALCDAYLEKMKKEGRSENTLNKNAWLMKVLGGPLSHRPISEIRPKEVLGVLKKLEDSGRTNSAIEARAAFGRIFRFAIASDLIDTDPTYALRGALLTHTPESFAAITEPKAVGAMIRTIRSYEGGQYCTKALLLAQMYCFARPSETRTMQWSELDLDRKVWTIPAEKTKLRRLLDVPLSTQMLEVIESMRPHTGNRSDVFGSVVAGKRYQSENTMNSALRRMGITKEEHTAHGFRSTASTLLNESRQFRGEVIEAQLAHKDKDAVRAIYNRALYWDERVPMMQWYADHLDELGSAR